MRSFFTCLLFVVAACVPACRPDVASLSIDGRTMGTTYSVQIPSMPFAERAIISADIEVALAGINSSMSTYQVDSAISLFNRSRSVDWQSVPANLARVAAAAQSLAASSNGAFDATVSPLLRLWGFGAGAADALAPSTNEIAVALQVTGYEQLRVRLAPPALKKRVPELEIDLSAIAKGFAVDMIAELIENRGYKNYLVEIGGELRVSGSNSDGDPWKIGVENPTAGSPAWTLEMTSGGVATSGDYRNFRVGSEQRYTHIVDPRSGSPVSHNLASVTVIHNTTMLADGWSTALMVLGLEDGLTLANTRQLEALFIVRTDDGYSASSSDSFRSAR